MVLLNNFRSCNLLLFVKMATIFVIYFLILNSLPSKFNIEPTQVTILHLKLFLMIMIIRRVDRFHRTLADIANKQLAFKNNLSPKYWKFSIKHVADLRNIRPKKILKGNSPYFLYYGSPYYLSEFLTFPFGSVVMSQIHLPKNCYIWTL